MSGFDWWELLINIPLAQVLTVGEKIGENLSEYHPPALKKYLDTRMMMLKTSLFRLSSTLQIKATTAMVQAHLSVIVSLCRQLRPVTVDVSPDKCVSAMMAEYVNSRAALDQLDLDKSVDQFLMTVTQAMDCQVDPKMGKYLQPLAQYVADLALFLLIVTAQTNKVSPFRRI